MKRTNVALIAVATVAIAAALVLSFDILDDGSDDSSGSRFDYTLIELTDEMWEWSTPDDAMAQIEEAVDAFLAAASAEGADMASAVEALDDAFDDVERQFILFDWAYYRDPGTYYGDYTAWNALYDSLADTRDDALRQALMGVNGDALRDAIGDEEADRILSSESMTEEVVTLLAEEAALMNFYYNYTGDGTGYAEIMLELVEVRNAIAACYGYDNYVDFAYAEVYHRDYTPDQADEMKDAVKEFVGGLYSDITVDYDAFYGLFTYTDQEELFDFVEPFIDSICPEFAEVYDYMIGYGLIDFEDLDTKFVSSYTSWTPYFAYIFGIPYLDTYDVRVLVHEFGHAAHYYVNDRTLNDDNDIVEIHSKGLEMLLTLDPGIILSEGEGLFTATMLKNTLWNVLSGCLVDDFEKALYYGDVTTAEEMEELWGRLLAEYRCDPYSLNDWYDIGHIFSGPVYYISYGVSAFSALEIFVLGLEDYDAAVDLYLDIVAYTDTGINGMTEALGMMSFFDQEDVETVFEAIREFALS